MSSLVLELQAGALNSSVSVLDLLRKALVVAKKLGVEDFQKWIELELDGYKQIPIPEYRLIRGQLRGWNPYHEWVPIQTHDPQIKNFYESVCNCSISQRISELLPSLIIKTKIYVSNRHLK